MGLRQKKAETGKPHCRSQMHLWIEIAETEAGKFLLQLIEPLTNTQCFHVVRQAKALPVPFRIHIQIAKLNKVGMVKPDQGAKGVKLPHRVSETRVDKVIKGNKTAAFLHDID